MPDSTPGDAYRLAGDRLGKFVILDELGRGSMGVVYEAFQTDLKRKVALKILPANISLDAKHVKRFRREAESMARLKHDNIIHIYEVGEIEGTHYFAMELIDGQPLGEQVGRDRDSVLDSARMVMDAANGLAHAHEHGVIHRDIKPSNLLVGRDGRIVVTDFGLARLTDSASLTSTDAIVGTPKYMSPEQILPGTKPIDGRTDVYSLGATLYHITTGRPPFDEPSVQAFIRAILESRPSSPRKFNRQVPHDLATIMLRCLEKDPKDRYADSGEFAKDLQRFLAGDRIDAKPKGMLALGFETVRRHKLITSLAGIAVIALVLVLWLGGEAAKESRGRFISEQLSRIQKMEDLDEAAVQIEALRDRFPREQSVADVRSVIYKRHAHAKLTDPEPDFEVVLNSLELAGEHNTFWHLMMLLETRQTAEARTTAKALAVGDLRRLAHAQLALVDGDPDRALALSEKAVGPDPVQLHIYMLLARGEAHFQLAVDTEDEAEATAQLKQAEEALSDARGRAQGISERYLRSRVEVKLLDVLGSLKPSETIDPTKVILDGASALREILRNLTSLWGDMTRPEAAVAQEFVDRILALNALKNPPANLERKALELVAAAADDRTRVAANLLLAVARLSRGKAETASEAVDDAQYLLGVDDAILQVYVHWAKSIVFRADNDIPSAVGWAVQAVRGMPQGKFQDIEALIRYTVLLGEEARKREQNEAAKIVGDFMKKQLEKLKERPVAWFSEVLERVSNLSASPAPQR